MRLSIIILNSIFSSLVNAGYLAANPLSPSRQRPRKTKPRVTMFLDEDLWNKVKMAIESMPRESFREREHYHRVRWLSPLLYITGIRISEVIVNSMGSFFIRQVRKDEQ